MLSKNPNKKIAKECHKKNRVLVAFNCGERNHKSKKDYNRQKFKKITY